MAEAQPVAKAASPVPEGDTAARGTSDHDALALLSNAAVMLEAAGPKKEDGGSPGEAGTLRRRTKRVFKDVLPFPGQLYLMLQDAACAHAIRWSDDGERIQIVDSHAMETDKILNKYYKHNNYRSFTKMLHACQFTSVGRVGFPEYEHPNFKKGRLDLLPAIRNKPRNRTPGKKSDSARKRGLGGSEDEMTADEGDDATITETDGSAIKPPSPPQFTLPAATDGEPVLVPMDADAVQTPVKQHHIAPAVTPATADGEDTGSRRRTKRAFKDVLPFPGQLWLMLQDETCAHAIRWSEDGKKVIVTNPKAMETEGILRRYYEHSSMRNFSKMLNACGFQKQSKNAQQYEHEYFQRGHRELLSQIRNRRTIKRQMKNALPSAAEDGASAAKIAKTVKDVKEHPNQASDKEEDDGSAAIAAASVPALADNATAGAVAVEHSVVPAL
eukprot:TRINITY_DN1058_c0_g1_i1.p2 TRINITY_DN1058_c0_g1~~TRINITY_DN1058_c0_g1_i1.p2  ORF type:complete len:461 (-),score=98.97 TRINITY_DN1058_c0_g1_i1:1671-2996(-)